jgi:hypothetical protein
MGNCMAPAGGPQGGKKDSNWTQVANSPLSPTEILRFVSSAASLCLYGLLLQLRARCLFEPTFLHPHLPVYYARALIPTVAYGKKRATFLLRARPLALVQSAFAATTLTVSDNRKCASQRARSALGKTFLCYVGVLPLPLKKACKAHTFI